MVYRNVNFPVFSIIDRNIFDNLIEIIKENNFFFKDVSIVCGSFGYKLIEKYRLKKQFQKTYIYTLRKETELSKLKSDVISNKSEVIISIGGGNVNDVAKYLSMETSLPLISIPTILSNDGIASPISILRLNGKYKSVGTTPPIGIIADIDIIKEADSSYILSGLGDLMSNISATLDWMLSVRENGEKIDLYAFNIAKDSALSMLYYYKTGKYTDLKGDNLIQDLFNGLIMSAISMIISKSSRPASGAEHNISHSLDRLNSKEKHGIQVGYSTLFTLFLHGEHKILEDLLNFYKFAGFPLDFDKLKFSKDMFIRAVNFAPHLRSRYTVLNKFYSSIDENLEKFFQFLGKVK